ncbi:hypothetical protein OF829_09565 [Sphingomonas sp. LB-2]|uniref:hypothetical protein n=1 Tax=Sphingomonas caeni TaxID=2984949 RepID=UPI002230E201|nr:hypothetical protein [Sphingomonas caeni]MCW3847490.1 hypothetical protein [Sphingomonas caeni]
MTGVGQIVDGMTQSAYIFHTGAGENGLWYTILDNLGWQLDSQAPNTGSSNTVAAVNYAGNMVVIHQGQNSENLWWNSFDGNSWAGDQQVPNTETGNGAAATVYNGQIYAFHMSSQATPGKESIAPGVWQIWCNIFDGSNWLGDNPVPMQASGTPSAVVYDGLLYVFHNDSNPTYLTEQLWYNSFDGASWGSDTEIPGVGSFSPPCAVVFQNLIYLFYSSGDNSYYATFDGTTWSNPVEIPISMSVPCGAAECDGLIYLFWNASQQLYYATFDGTNWQTEEQVPSAELDGTPSVVIFPA